MDRLNIRVRAVGRPNSSKRVRCYQKRQSSSDRKKFSHIRSFFCWPFFNFLLTRPTCSRIYSQKRRSPGAGGRLSSGQLSSEPFFTLFIAVCQRMGRHVKENV